MSTITITKGVLTVGATNYQIRNINFTEKYLFKPTYEVGIATLIYLLLSILPLGIITMALPDTLNLISFFYFFFWIRHSARKRGRK